MSKIKELRNNPKYNINIVDFLCDIFPNDETKYVETFLRIFDNLPAINGEVEATYTGIMNTFGSDYDIPMGKEFKTKGFHLILHQYMVDRFINKSNIQEYIKFIKYSESNLLTNKDLSTYKKFSEVISENVKVKQKLAERDLEKQTVKLHDDDEWFVLKPLTFEASKKYGSNTTWCTTMKDFPEHFETYSSDGILIYCINKKDHQKTVAIHYHLKKKELSFWDVEDRRLDSIQTSLNHGLIYEIIGHINENLFSNHSLYKKIESQKKLEVHKENLKKIDNKFVSPGVSVTEHDESLISNRLIEDLMVDVVDFDETRNVFKYFNSTNDLIKLNSILERFGDVLR